MTAEEGDFVAEMMKGVSAIVAAKVYLSLYFFVPWLNNGGQFANGGLRRITRILSSPISRSLSDINLIISKAGEVLRLLIKIVEPHRNASPLPLELDAPVQDGLIVTIKEILSAILADLTSDRPAHDPKKLAELSIFIARIIQFDIVFSGAWTQYLKRQCEELCDVIVQLALVSLRSSSKLYVADELCSGLVLGKASAR